MDSIKGRERLRIQSMSEWMSKFDSGLLLYCCLEMNKFIPTGRIDPSSYNQLLDPVEARYRLARAVLAEIPRQVIQ
jgi:hypothetical protein